MHMLPDGSDIVQTKSEAYQSIIYNLQTVMRGCSVWPVKGMEKSRVLKRWVQVKIHEAAREEKGDSMVAKEALGCKFSYVMAERGKEVL